MRVADDQVAVAVDAQAARPAVAEVGRGPRDAEVLAVEVERLDAGGEVHDPEPVAGGRWRRPRASKVAGSHALLPRRGRRAFASSCGMRA